MIGPHILGSINPHEAGLKAWQPRSATIVDPITGEVSKLKLWCPSTIVVGRVYRPDEEIAATIRSNYVSAARWAADLSVAAADKNPTTDYWQVNNEILQTSAGGIDLLSKFTIEYVKNLSAVGLRAAIGSFGVGQPQAPEIDGGAAWRAFYPAMYEGRKRSAVLLLHAYGAPSIFQPDKSWYLHRYEMRVMPHLPADLRDMPYVYGEYGCDAGVHTYGLREGWKTQYNGDYVRYGSDLLIAAKFLAKFPNCLGANVFTLGVVNSDWVAYDIAGEPAKYFASIDWPGDAPQEPQEPGDGGMSDRIIENKPPHISFTFVDESKLQPGDSYWKLVKFRFRDENEANGLTNMFSWEPHDPAVTMVARNQNGNTFKAVHEKPLNEPAANLPKWSGNIYGVWTEGKGAVASDVVHGCQLLSAAGQPNAHVVEDMWWELVTVEQPAAPPAEDLDTVLLQEGEAHQVIQFNPAAALQKRIFADGFVPNSPEFDVEVNGVAYRAQRAEHLGTGEVRVYAAPIGQWDKVFYVVRQ